MPLPKGVKVVGAKKVKEEGTKKCKIQLFGTKPGSKKVEYLETRKGLYPCDNKDKAKK